MSEAQDINPETVSQTTEVAPKPTVGEVSPDQPVNIVPNQSNIAATQPEQQLSAQAPIPPVSNPALTEKAAVQPASPGQPWWVWLIILGVVVVVLGILSYFGIRSFIGSFYSSVKKTGSTISTSVNSQTGNGITYSVEENIITQADNVTQIKQVISDFFVAEKAQDSSKSFKLISSTDGIKESYLKDYYSRSKESIQGFQIATVTWQDYTTQSTYSGYPLANTAVARVHLSRTNSYLGSQDADIDISLLYDKSWKVVTSKDLIPTKLSDQNVGKTVSDGGGAYIYGLTIKQIAIFKSKFIFAEDANVAGVAFPKIFFPKSPTLQDNLGNSYTVSSAYGGDINGSKQYTGPHYQIFEPASNVSNINSSISSLVYSFGITSANLPVEDYGTQVININL